MISVNKKTTERLDRRVGSYKPSKMPRWWCLPFLWRLRLQFFALLFDALGHLPASLEDMDLSELDSNIMHR